MAVNSGGQRALERRYCDSLQRLSLDKRPERYKLKVNALRELYSDFNGEVWALLDGGSIAFSTVSVEALKRRQKSWRARVEKLRCYKSIYSDFSELLTIYSSLVDTVYSKSLDHAEVGGGLEVTALDARPTCKLSIVVTTRNDDHGQKLHERTSLFLGTLAAQVKEFALDLELVVVEWNPPHERSKFEERYVNLLKSFPRYRVITVSSEIHKTLKGKDRYPLYQMLAKNVGIRRSSGEHILCTNIDVIFSNELIEFISANPLEQNCIYRVQRFDCRDTAYDLLGGSPLRVSQSLLTHTYRINIGTRSIDLPNTNKNLQTKRSVPGKRSLASILGGISSNACGDFQLLSRLGWYKLRGYPEWDCFSMHLDSFLQAQAVLTGMKEVRLLPPYNVFHIDHENGWSQESEKDGKFSALLEKKRLKHIRYEEYTSYCKLLQLGILKKVVNKENWGLVDAVSYSANKYSIVISSLPKTKNFPLHLPAIKSANELRSRKLALDSNRYYSNLMYLAEAVIDWTQEHDTQLVFWGYSRNGRDLVNMLYNFYHEFYKTSFFGFIDIDNTKWGYQERCKISSVCNVYLRNIQKSAARSNPSLTIYPPSITENKAFQPCILITCGDMATPYQYLENSGYETKRVMLCDL